MSVSPGKVVELPPQFATTLQQLNTAAARDYFDATDIACRALELLCHVAASEDRRTNLAALS